MAYGKRYGRGEMSMSTSKSGQKYGDGYMAAKEMSYGSAGANVTQSRLEKRKGYRGGMGKGGGYMMKGMKRGYKM